MKKGCYIYLLLSLVLLLQDTVVAAKELPVLPYPQYVQTSNSQVAISSNLSLNFRLVNKDVVNRLSEHWMAFRSKTAPSLKAVTSINVGILGKDKKFDAEVMKYAASRMDKIGKEGYVLVINKKQSILAANTETGLFYGLQSLKQLIRASWNKEVNIVDWPSFPNRVIFDDISRGPISTVNYIKEQIERMAEIKVNGLSFYIEHVVQPLSHPDFAPDSGKLTIPQIKELSAYATKHHIQLIGSFQSFGHFEKILSLPQYKSMGETSTLISPLDPKARKFLENVIGELCDAFGSPYFNVNCDETFDLTKGRSKKYIDSIGAARFYADHLKFLYDIVKRHNKQMIMWGDVALQHEEVLDMLPKDVIYGTWEYSENKSYDKLILPFKKRGLQFMVCPGILNSYRMFPDMTMASSNIRYFVNDAAKHGAAGVITTVWDDGGTYLFSGDWYGVYVAADKSWNADPKWESSFDNRYEKAAYGTDNGAYVKALNKLMELRALPITYNLNDQVWRQKILPDSGQQLIVNNTSAKDALTIITAADQLLAAANPQSHRTDISTLQFGIDQYRLIIDTRIQLADVAQKYYKAVSLSNATPQNSIAVLMEADKKVMEIALRHLLLKEQFRTAWLKENQPYSLNVVLDSYDKRINDLKQLSGNLHAAITALKAKTKLPEVSHVRLNIKESPEYYFQNWMFGGPFPFSSKDKIPDFLYSENTEYNKPPIPGDFIHYQGIAYRWQKYASQDGGVIDLDENYKSPNSSLVYAYCNITVEHPITVKAFFAAYDGGEIFCNGENVFSSINGGQPDGEERSMTLTLKAGVNHLLMKLPKKEGHPWTFTFRLDKDLSVTTHKHKYQLNPKKTTYEAD
ncbi:glycoside hydrolase family 20 zincin-like fold domain-containing protein [Flavisolibacter tropicus]|uniref:beta-N-acetylhexosaminidase n=1 Tax=Flavisolibacter tropicus TaxID=1492898 RepID=A0A172TWX5_9BACT|nr:glycoside hydrolase family 20 zincin-like fold domain-containing protein [Flavisolibacter tropicus]ANE51482.1 hypothetical protein SY85_14180 [Flavisolibacter tropicus]